MTAFDRSGECKTARQPIASYISHQFYLPLTRMIDTRHIHLSVSSQERDAAHSGVAVFGAWRWWHILTWWCACQCLQAALIATVHAILALPWPCLCWLTAALR